MNCDVFDAEDTFGGIGGGDTSGVMRVVQTLSEEQTKMVRRRVELELDWAVEVVNGLKVKEKAYME